MNRITVTSLTDTGESVTTTVTLERFRGTITPPIAKSVLNILALGAGTSVTIDTPWGDTWKSTTYALEEGE